MASQDTKSPSALLDDEAIEQLTEERFEEAPETGPALDRRDEDEEPEEPLAELSWRIALAIAMPVIASGVMVGGIFKGASPRIVAAVAGLLGIALAAWLARMRKPLVMMLLNILGLFAIGLIVVIPTGIDNVFDLGAVVSAARGGGDVLRPPVEMTPGWQAIVGWLMGLLAFTTGWVAFVLRRPTTALLLPLPIAAIAGISVPDDAQVASGIVVLVLFALSMGLLSSATIGDDDERPPLAYEVRRTLKALPLLGVLTVALVFLSQAGFLFPDSVIDPTREPQRPTTVPLSEVEDRVLFAVSNRGGITGPWRTGSLDVYDGESWRLPPFAENEIDDVPESGIVDEDVEAGAVAKFEVLGLTGAVLPTLPNAQGIVAAGPRLSYDPRNGNIRLAEGQVEPGLVYTVTAAALPSAQDLRELEGEVPGEIVQFTEIPPPPPGIQSLIDQAPTTSKWDQFNWLRLYVLDNVTVSGPGIPVDITPARAEEILAASEMRGTPFEIVALQAMLARWIDVPSRIGFGFDGGEDAGDGALEVRPRHGATFVEVYFPGFKWLPVIGTPKNAEPSLGNEGDLNYDPTILPSDDISVQLFLPLAVPPGGTLVKQLRLILLYGVPLISLIALIYFTYPALRKARMRGKRRRAAVAAGARARIALAYAEWRDLCTDYGYRYHSDTPLMFVDRFVGDEEHTEFAWLVTRTMWGDLDEHLTPDLAAAAEELSRTLRRRLAQAQPASMRFVAAVSRLSLREPYAPETDLVPRRTLGRKTREKTPVPA
ncbi:MAG TPA: DUF3488 and transglutaminase-like domain-containing protein [Nitriliruptorales bacterium]